MGNLWLSISLRSIRSIVARRRLIRDVGPEIESLAKPRDTDFFSTSDARLITIVTVKKCLFLLPLLLASCASQQRLQIAALSIPSSPGAVTSDPSALMRTAQKMGGSVREWSVPVAPDGTFALKRQKKDTYVSAYDPPTASHPTAIPVEYDSKLLGVAATGRVSAASDSREIQMSFTDCQKTGVVHYGSGVEQPVYRTRSVDTSKVILSSEWAVLHEMPATAKDPGRHILLVKAP